MVGLGLQLELQSLVVLHLVECPRGADGKNVLSFMLALVLVIIVGDEAGLVGFNCAGAVSREELESELGIDIDDIGSFGLLVSGVVERVVVTGEGVILSDG